ncbi:MAG: hypothetical protein WAW17_28255 [Rhodococcus sp. (in: high G+C Gram-positive bacteria)]
MGSTSGRGLQLGVHSDMDDQESARGKDAYSTRSLQCFVGTHGTK